MSYKKIDFNKLKGKKVLVTGHTGFKGTWLCFVLNKLGANVLGYSLRPETPKNLFDLSEIENNITSIYGDIRDFDEIYKVFQSYNPEYVFHLAAQPIVSEGYNNPLYTYQTNVMGTVNVLECVRKTPSVKSFLNVTTDKVYQNKEWVWGYRENETLNGHDPYSNSKSCSELVTNCYKNSFFNDSNCAISTARAGNVIGGGDFAKDRIIPDCFRFAEKKKNIIIRNPHSIRPYQHVLEPIFAYIAIGLEQAENSEIADCFNIGPIDSDCISTGALADIFCSEWRDGLKWINEYQEGPHEANFLKLDCSKFRKAFNWSPKWNIQTAVKYTVDWYKSYLNGESVKECMYVQIKKYFNMCANEICYK